MYAKLRAQRANRSREPDGYCCTSRDLLSSAKSLAVSNWPDNIGSANMLVARRVVLQ